MTNRYEAHKKLQDMIYSCNGDIGEVEDFIIDDVSWKIHFHCRKPATGFRKKVIISPRWIKM
jgi:hypothetical protein